MCVRANVTKKKNVTQEEGCAPVSLLLSTMSRCCCCCEEHRLSIDELLQRRLPAKVNPNELVALSQEGRGILRSLIGLKAQIEHDHGIDLTNYALFSMLEAYHRFLLTFDALHASLGSKHEDTISSSILQISMTHGKELGDWLKQFHDDLLAMPTPKGRSTTAPPSGNGEKTKRKQATPGIGELPCTVL